MSLSAHKALPKVASNGALGVSCENVSRHEFYTLVNELGMHRFRREMWSEFYARVMKAQLDNS